MLNFWIRRLKDVWTPEAAEDLLLARNPEAEAEILALITAEMADAELLETED